MEIKSQAKIFKKKSKDPFKISIIFLVLIVALTGTLYFFNMSLENKIKSLDENITSKENSIRDLEKNRKIVISRLYKANKNSIEKIEDFSKITTYINHLYFLERKYNINFKGLNYDSGKITTQVISESNSKGIDYKKTYNFIKSYRENKDFIALFDLSLIKSIAEKQSIYNEFSIELNLKKNIRNILKDYEKNKLKKSNVEKNLDKSEIEKRKQAIAERIKNKIKQKNK